MLTNELTFCARQHDPPPPPPPKKSMFTMHIYPSVKVYILGLPLKNIALHEKYADTMQCQENIVS